MEQLIVHRLAVLARNRDFRYDCEVFRVQLAGILWLEVVRLVDRSLPRVQMLLVHAIFSSSTENTLKKSALILTRQARHFFGAFLRTRPFSFWDV